jgi:hypothetical protein
MQTPLTVCVALAAASLARADVISLSPMADAFVSSAQPAGNFGGAGALSVAAPGQPQGEFQTVLRFDTAAAVTAFNNSYGAGNWSISGISFSFTTTAPNNPIFSPPGAGNFSMNWMQNDSWTEGTGGPSSPAATGITFATLSTFLSPGDEFLGSFGFPGNTSGTVLCQTTIAPGFAGDVGLGNLVSIRLAATTAGTAWVFNSRSFGTVPSRPIMSITAVPAPGAATALAIAGAAVMRRRR